MEVGRGLGWEYVHVAVDDASRPANTELMPELFGAVDRRQQT
jgi:hypothetical protein